MDFFKGSLSLLLILFLILMGNPGSSQHQRGREEITWNSDNQILIQKEKVNIRIESNAPPIIKELKRDRIFNMMPGFEAVPLVARLSAEMKELQCIIKVEKS